jgi:enoyl-CoA hydratase/carnithine racemase
MKLSFLKELAVTCEKKDAAWAKQAGLIDILVENEVEVASFLDNHSSNLVVFLKSLRSNDPELIADFEVRIKEVVAFLSLPETKDKLKKYLEEISKSA